jgi:hypothetical protein
MTISIESKEFLKMNGMNFLVDSLQTTLFNYASVCKVIDSIKINIMINHNFKYDHRKYLIEQEILKLLISNTSKLKRLIIRYDL